MTLTAWGKSQIMKIVTAKLALPAAILAMAFSVARAEEAAGPPVTTQEVQAKIQYCSTCHGPMGQGFKGAFPIPRLAGQQVEYFENQLLAFYEGRRSNKYMFAVSHHLSPAMRTALAKHFNGLNPKPYGTPSKDLVPAGKKIFEEGVPEASVPPCASCHGEDAKGNGAFPRLAGQYHAYIEKALANFEKVRGQDPNKPDTSAIMQPIAHVLTEPQIAAVAAYLNQLE
jgi:cytochrome c553